MTERKKTKARREKKKERERRRERERQRETERDTERDTERERKRERDRESERERHRERERERGWEGEREGGRIFVPTLFDPQILPKARGNLPSLRFEYTEEKKDLTKLFLLLLVPLSLLVQSRYLWLALAYKNRGNRINFQMLEITG